jgi:zinc D-Ala-D-Ala carboxypeptidase
MKKLIFIYMSIAVFSCKEQDRTPSTSEATARDTITADNPPPGNIQEERDGLQTEIEQPRVAVALDGKYRKIENGEAASDCNCNCIEIDFDHPTEWCIDKDKLFITARTQKTGENSAEVYFVSASREMNPDREMPWDDFDTNTPVATINFTPDGGAELDWLGFSTNGEISTDYALYGKKTLEGTYKKE